MENKKEKYDLRHQIILDNADPYLGRIYYLQIQKKKAQ